MSVLEPGTCTEGGQHIEADREEPEVMHLEEGWVARECAGLTGEESEMHLQSWAGGNPGGRGLTRRQWFLTNRLTSQ